jgi:uncharacterized protein with ATP-grasp and redox domains
MQVDMKTYLDCIPCFFKQALEASRIAGADIHAQRDILHEVAGAIPGFPLEASPPEMGRTVYNLVRERTNTEDPYKTIKEANNRRALGMLDRMAERVNRSDDRLLAAVELAIAGNVVDCGVNDPAHIDGELAALISSRRKTGSPGNRDFFDYPKFRDSLLAAQAILYLADNAGETVFDRVLLETIKSIDRGKEITYAVKDKPIINDALVADAVDCGIGTVAEIISSGSDAPGTIPSLCSEHFLSVYRNADILIAKCPVIARDIGCRVGDFILLFHTGDR